MNANDFGIYADQVEDFGGELILPISDSIEIHPSGKGDWAVMSIKPMQVLSRFADIGEAVRFAEARCSDEEYVMCKTPGCELEIGHGGAHAKVIT